MTTPTKQTSPDEQLISDQPLSDLPLTMQAEAVEQNPLATTENAEQDSTLMAVTPEVISLADGFDPFDSVATITFGKEALEKITALSDDVLSQVRVRDSGEAGEILQSMVESMDSSAFDNLNKGSILEKLPLIGELFNSFKKFSTSFDSIRGKLDQLTAQLEGQESKLAHDIMQLDGLYNNNLELLRGLEDYIAAGKYKLAQLRSDVLPVLLNAAEQSSDALDAQKYRDAEQSIARLEKRVHNLELTRLAAIQTAPQIRLSQEGNKMLMEDIQDIVHNTFPLWKRQFLIAISNYEKEKALTVTRTVKDYTNKQYVKNAERLKALEEQISENYQRGVLDLESLQTVNTLTIETLSNSLSRVKEGRAKREAAEKVIAQAEQELKDALQQTSDK